MRYICESESLGCMKVRAVDVALCETNNDQSSACSNVSVIEDESLSRNSSVLQQREKEPNFMQPAAEQKPDRIWKQYIIFPTTVAGIV